VSQKIDFQELCLVSLLRLSYLAPHYWTNFFELASLFLQTNEQKATLKRAILEVEKSVLEESEWYNYIVCRDCKKKWRTEDDNLVHNCPKCNSQNTLVIKDRHSLFDIEFAMESIRDYGAFFDRYGEHISKFDVERKLIKIKNWVWEIISEVGSKRRFRRGI
jgi:DNA-directed RNA polymerase subunit RPC12/RpoP